jgi:hypothetical protein
MFKKIISHPLLLITKKVPEKMVSVDVCIPIMIRKQIYFFTSSLIASNAFQVA